LEQDSLQWMYSGPHPCMAVNYLRYNHFREHMTRCGLLQHDNMTIYLLSMYSSKEDSGYKNPVVPPPSPPPSS
jgi:hypothetical protein